jgi:hypothetical protein
MMAVYQNDGCLSRCWQFIKMMAVYQNDGSLSK